MNKLIAKAPIFVSSTILENGNKALAVKTGCVEIFAEKVSTGYGKLVAFSNVGDQQFEVLKADLDASEASGEELVAAMMYAAYLNSGAIMVTEEVPTKAVTTEGVKSFVVENEQEVCEYLEDFSQKFLTHISLQERLANYFGQAV